MAETTIGKRTVPVQDGPLSVVTFTGGKHGPEEAGRYAFWVAIVSEEGKSIIVRALEHLPAGERFSRMETAPGYESTWAAVKKAHHVRPATRGEIEKWLASHRGDAIYADRMEIAGQVFDLPGAQERAARADRQQRVASALGSAVEPSILEQRADVVSGMLRGREADTATAKSFLLECANMLDAGKPLPRKVRQTIAEILRWTGVGGAPLDLRPAVAPGRPGKKDLTGPTVLAATMRLFELAGVSSASAKRTLEELGVGASARTIERAVKSVAWAREAGEVDEIRALRLWAEYGPAWNKIMDPTHRPPGLSPEATRDCDALRQKCQ